MPRREVEEGKHSSVVKERGRPKVYINLLFSQDTSLNLHSAHLHPRFLGFLCKFQFLFSGQRSSTVSLQLGLHRFSDTNCHQVPVPLWLQGNRDPHRWARLPVGGGCYDHVVGSGEHTHRHAYTAAAEGCVKCVNRLLWDCNLDLTPLSLDFLQALGLSFVRSKIVQALDLLMIWPLWKVYIFTVTTGGLT